MSTKRLRIYKEYPDKNPVDVAFEESLTAADIIPLLKIQETNIASNKYGLMIQSNQSGIKWIPDDIAFKKLLIKNTDSIFAEPLVKLINVILPGNSSEYIALEMNAPSEHITEKCCLFFNIWPHQVWNIFMMENNQKRMFIPGVSLAEQCPTVKTIFLRQTNFSPLITTKIAYPLHIYLAQYRTMIINKELVLSKNDISFLNGFKWFQEKDEKLAISKSNSEKINEFNKLTALNGFGAMNYHCRITFIEKENVSDQVLRIISITNQSIACYVDYNSDPEIIYSFSTIFGFAVNGPYLRIFLDEEGKSSWCIFNNNAREMLAIIESNIGMKSVTPRPYQQTTSIIVSTQVVEEKSPYRKPFEVFDPNETIIECIQNINNAVASYQDSAKSGSYSIDNVRNRISLSSMIDEAKTISLGEDNYGDSPYIHLINNIENIIQEVNKPMKQERYISKLEEIHNESLDFIQNSNKQFSEIRLSDEEVNPSEISFDEQSDDDIETQMIFGNSNNIKNITVSVFHEPKALKKLELKPFEPCNMNFDEFKEKTPLSIPPINNSSNLSNNSLILNTSKEVQPNSPSELDTPKNSFIAEESKSSIILPPPLETEPLNLPPNNEFFTPKKTDNEALGSYSAIENPSPKLSVPLMNEQIKIVQPKKLENSQEKVIKVQKVNQSINIKGELSDVDSKIQKINVAQPKSEKDVRLAANSNAEVKNNVQMIERQKVEPKPAGKVSEEKIKNGETEFLVQKVPADEKASQNYETEAFIRRTPQNSVDQSQYQTINSQHYLATAPLPINPSSSIGNQAIYPCQLMEMPPQALITADGIPIPYQRQVPMQYGMYPPVGMPYGMQMPQNTTPQSPVNVRVCIDNSKKNRLNKAREKLKFDEENDSEYEYSSDDEESVDKNAARKRSSAAKPSPKKKSLNTESLTLPELLDEVEESVDLIQRSIEVGGNVKNDQKNLLALIKELKQRANSAEDDVKESLENTIFSAEKIATTKSLTKTKITKLSAEIQTSIKDLRKDKKTSKLSSVNLNASRKASSAPKEFIYEDAETEIAKATAQKPNIDLQNSLSSLATSILAATTTFIKTDS
ncbi:hypothetical protein TVAG_063660 [Trichomonas vaginalis G3]|uniref:Uncharacterized protein n=1 Tax=Trichomonas vaginalis (strain ATCC PRA-98 / G3) TaxID=412133 RepID=A2EU36_TRIV3|nr:hypothetical protein TVAGG3_0954930 [Trichomonas vaginalis G3]EAY03853.1 hypothetical protein TVAG_063660 [Trichomonas vaginalis G3]KAI5487481.1 hypothetical protein TVAGG3_0954930 [Trichomonas vaginalis G3]|eukprot:XP_001316076.1 hypothetical protein [Trichomonas vaginalis G3]